MVSSASSASVSPIPQSSLRLSRPEPPDFSAEEWLLKFDTQADASPTVLAACHAATAKVAGYLAELEGNIKFMLDSAMKQQQSGYGTGEPATDTPDKMEHPLAQSRRAMDNADESTFRQLRYQEDQLLLCEFLQMLGVIRKVLDGAAYTTKVGAAIQHDLEVSLRCGKSADESCWISPVSHLSCIYGLEPDSPCR